MAPVLRSLALLALCAAAVVWLRGAGPAEGGIDAEVRAAGLRFSPSVPAADRGWVLAAIAAARPEAQRLVGEVDGTVVVRVHGNEGDAIGWARSGPDGSVVSFDTRALNGDRAVDRNVVVLHELGHVIDYELVPDELVRRLDAGIPRDGSCARLPGACSSQERFADTFAKWALRGSVSLAGSGYGIATPPSLEDWGAPLGRLAAELSTAGRASSDGRQVVARAG